MRKSLVPVVLSLLATIILSSCESTLDYGYYVGQLDEASIETLFQISDEAAENQDIATYAGLYGPSFSTTDQTDGNHVITFRHDYLEFVENLFRTAKYIESNTMIMDIQFVEPGRKALVKVQEEEKREQFGNTQHFTSLLDIEVGYEDGWVFFEKSTRTSTQIIDE